MADAKTWSRALAVVLVLLFAAAAFVATRVARFPDAQALQACRQDLEVIAFDGARVPAVLYACDERPPTSAGVVVWPREPSAATGWVDELDGFARDGRAMLVLLGARRPGHERDDLQAAAEALAEDPAIDPDRVGAVLEGPLGEALVDSDTDEIARPPGIAAVVVSDPPEDARTWLSALEDSQTLVLDGTSEGVDERVFAFRRPTLSGAGEVALSFLAERLAAANVWEE